MIKLNALQFLRFLAFLLVFLFHSAHFQFLYNPGGGAAASAVSFFILLSGFLAGYTCVNQNIKCTLKECIKYVFKKIKKFYPLYIGTTAVTLLYSGLKTHLLLGNFEAVRDLLIQLFKNVFLIQSWFPTGYFSYNSPSWFLSTMMLLYLCKTPLTYYLQKISTKKYGVFVLIGLFFIFSTLFAAYCYAIGQSTYSPEFYLYIFPPARILEFTCGIILGFLMRLLYKKCTSPNIILFSILEFAAFYIWYQAYVTQQAEWECRSLRWFLPNLLILCIFSMNAGILSKLFSFKWLKYLGDISFESYMIHQVILTLCSYATGYLAPYISAFSGSYIWNGFLQLSCLFATLIISHFIATVFPMLHNHIFIKKVHKSTNNA